MKGKISILGVPFDDLNMAEAVDKAISFMAEKYPLQDSIFRRVYGSAIVLKA